MVGHYAHGYILLRVFTVSAIRQVADYLDDRLEHVGVVIGTFALHHSAQTFESHTRVDDFGRKGFQGLVGLTVVLHEHEVPYFDDQRVVLVHQFAAGHFRFFFFRTQVDMDFRTRTAGARGTHFPKVVVLVAVDDVVGREELLPIRSRFVVAFKSFFR